MKNHIRVDGWLLQTNKKWSHLKQTQKEWVYLVCKQEYDRFEQETGKLTIMASREVLYDCIYAVIQEREIWIPLCEVKNALNKRITRWNRAAMTPSVETNTTTE